MTSDEPLQFPGYEFEPPTPDGPEGEVDGLPSVPRPVNWNVLTSDRAAFEWVELDRWVNWLRRTYGLGPSIIPPLWHRHSELVWELSALHLHWLCAYDEEQHGSAPLGWHRTLPKLANACTTGLLLAARPRQSYTSDRLAWGGSGTVGRRGHDRGPRS